MYRTVIHTKEHLVLVEWNWYWSSALIHVLDHQKQTLKLSQLKFPEDGLLQNFCAFSIILECQLIWWQQNPNCVMTSHSRPKHFIQNKKHFCVLVHWSEIQCDVFLLAEKKPDKYIHLLGSEFALSFTFFREAEVRVLKHFSFSWDLCLSLFAKWVCLFVALTHLVSDISLWWLPF